MESLLRALCCLHRGKAVTLNHDSIHHSARPLSSDDRRISQVVHLLTTTEKTGNRLAAEVDAIIRADSWTEWLGENVLHAIEETLRDPPTLGPAIRRAYDDAVGAGEDIFAELFECAKQHKAEIAIVVLTIIAIGVLVAMVPWALEAIGFAIEGPLEGSWAALWQSRYAGWVPKNSLFSFFQRLGMTWTKQY